jgi:myo-inositol-1(or 4)-monophosphatase
VAQAASEAEARLAWASEVAGKVGALLMSRFRTGVAAERKTSGIVTALDTEAENLIAASLRETFPDDGMLSEEGTGIDSTSGWRWIVDPLDGTTNYVSGLPFFAVSLAGLKAGKVEVGLIHAPSLKETFTFLRGRGATGPEGRLAVSSPEYLSDAVFLINKAYYPPQTLWGVVHDLLSGIRAFRYLGAISTDLVAVAAGRADGIVLLPSPQWDIAAAVAMLEASGARVTDLAGDPPATEGRTAIVAAGPAVMEQALPLIHAERLESA